MAVIYLDGRFVDESRAKVPATDPALAWGVGLFEVVRGYNRRPFQLAAHMERLAASAEHFGLDARIPDLGPVIEELFARNELEGGYARITWTGGGHVIVVVSAWTAPPTRIYRKGGGLAIAPFRRDPAAPLAGHKTLNYLENMRTRWDAESHGVIDALVLGFRGEVLEGTRCNVFAVKDGRIATPPVGQGILPGVTRRLAVELAHEAGIELRERRVRLAELHDADEVFITSTMMEIVPIVRLGEAVLPGPGPVTKALRRAYGARVRKECGGR